MADVDLLFGVEGGGALSGASGKKIQNQLNNIIGNINKTLPEIKITLDQASLGRFRNDIHSLTNYAVSEANRVQAAWNIQFPPIPPGGGGGNRNPYSALIRENNVHSSAISLLKDINKAQREWTASKNGITSGAYADLQQMGGAIRVLIDNFEHGRLSINDFELAISGFKDTFKESTEEIARYGENIDVEKTLKDGTIAYTNAMDEINKLSHKYQNDYIAKWTAADGGASDASYRGLFTLIEDLDSLKQRLESGAISLADYRKELNRIKKAGDDAARSIDAVGEAHPVDSEEARNKKLKQAYNELSTMERNLSRWTAAEVGKSSKSFEAYSDSAVSLETAINKLKDGKMTLAEFNAELAKIQRNAAEAAEAIGKVDEDKKADKVLTKKSEEQLDAIDKVNKALKTATNNQKAWDAASENTSTKDAYDDIIKQTEALKKLKEALDSGTMTAKKFEEEYNAIEHSLNQDYSKIQLADMDHTKKQELERYNKTLSEVNTKLKQNENNLKEWSSAKAKVPDAYKDLEDVVAVLKKLQQELLTTGKVSDKVEKDLTDVFMKAEKASGKIRVGEADHKTFGDNVVGVIKEMSGYIDLMDVAFEAWEIGRRMVEAVTDIDTAMTELRKVTDETGASYNAFLEDASVRAKDLGATVTDVISSSADFARLGYDLDDASALADAAIVYKNVGDGISDIDTASSSIISTMQAFGIEASNAMSIVDSFNAIGNNFAISSGGVGDALLNSAASLHAAGNDIHESVALIAAANTTIQDPGRVGTALKTLSMYLRAAKTEAEDAGISTEGMADSVSQLRDELKALTGGRVDIMSDAEAGSYKSTVEILRELSEVWDDLSDTSRTNITELIGGGVRNANIISALMNNFELVDDAIAVSTKSSGSALQENERHLDSIVGKTAKFQATFETMAATFVDNDLIKGIVDAGTKLLEAGTWVGDNFGGALAIFTGGRVLDTITSFSGLIDEDSKVRKFFNAFKDGGQNVTRTFGTIKAGIELMSDLKSEGKSTSEAFGSSIQQIWSSISKGSKFTLAGLGIGLVVGAVTLLNKHWEEQIQIAQENAEAYTESAKSINEYKEESIDLIKTIESGVLSDEERYKARSRLSEIEKELTKTYGAQAKNLKLLSQTAKGAETEFKNLEIAQANQYQSYSEKEIKTATEQMTRSRSSVLGEFDWLSMSAEARAEVEKIVSQFDNVDLVYDVGGKRTLRSSESDARKLLDLNNRVSAAIVSSGGYVTDHFTSYAKQANDTLNTVIDSYGTTFDAGVQSAIIQSEEYTGILESFENSESAYTKAMSDSYDSTIDRAKAFDEAQKYVNDSIGEYESKRESIATDDAGVAKYFDSEIESLKKYNNALIFGSEILSATTGGKASDNINNVTDALDKLRNASGELDADYINDIGLGLKDGIADGEQEEAFVDLTEALAAYNLELQDAIPVMKAFGIIRKSTGELLDDATSSYKTVLAEQEAVKNAYKSQAAGQPVDLDTYKKLIDLSDDYANCLEYQNDTIQLNRQKLMDLSKARANENLLTIQSNKLEAQNRYAENAKAIEDYQKKIEGVTDATEDLLDKWKAEKKELESKNETIRDSIIEYSLMAEAIENSISRYSEWVNAQSETQSGAWHASASSGLTQLKELYKNKEYGNTVLQEGLEFFTGKNITGLDSWQERVTAINSAYKQITTTIEGTSYSLNSFMQSGRTGANNFLNAVRQLGKGWAEFDYATQQWTLNYDNEQLADELGTTEEFIVMMNGLLEQYGFEFDSSKLMTTEEKSIKEATDLVEKYKKTVEDTDDLNIETVDSSKVQETEAQVADIATQLAALPKETLVSLGFNFDGVDDANIAQAIQEQLPNISLGDKSIVVPDATAKVNYELGEVAKPTDATVKVNYELGSVARPTIYGGQSSVSGTAKFNGDVGTAPGGRTLVGELGREMYVDPATNTWRTIGDNGAEFVNLPRNAIVFNHRQTHSLLTSGKISARGKALVSGNAAANVAREYDDILKPQLASVFDSYVPTKPTIEPVKSDDPGGGPGGGPGVSGGSSKNKKKKKKEKSFEDLYKKHNHLREMDKETDEEYLDWLEGAYKEAYEKGEISLDDYRKYAEEVYELQKELFQDSLNDMEHEISILERESGNESQIISMYKDMMSKIQKEIKAAKKRGLDDDSDYIQDLLDQYYEYADVIEEIQDEITDGATSAVEDLVDYKIQMIKQDLENEKDALNEKLDDLKDFYDKQKKMLRDARDEEKYLDEQSEKRKGVSDIQAEIAQLSMDNSAWAQKRKLELQEELVKAQKELDEFEKDHALDTTEDFLDKMYEQQEAQIESQISAIDEKLNDPNALYNQALAAIQNNTAELYKEMVNYNNKYGDGNPETVSKMWDEAYESLNAYLELFGKAYKDIVLVGDSSSVSGYASGTRRATPGPHKVFENGDEYIFQASDGTRYKMFSGGEKVLNAKATNFLYDFATSGGKILASMLPGIMGGGALSKISRPLQPIQLSTGNIIIEGNANERTVSEIRRAQREGIDYILKEFTRLNK